MDITQKHLIMQAFCSINFHIQKSAVIFPNVFQMKTQQKMTALLFFHYPTRDGMNKSAVIFFCVLPQAHLF